MWAHFHFHSDLSHHDVLEEGCHRPCWSGWICSSTCSADSWCRLFFKETAARKSDRNFIGLFLPAFFKVRYHCPWYLFFPDRVKRYVWSSCASSSRSLHFCFVHPIASCDSRFTGSLRNRLWISVKRSAWESTYLQHLFHVFQATWYSFVLSCRAPWASPFFIT